MEYNRSLRLTINDLAPDGDVIAQIHKERGLIQLIRLADAYRIEISRQCIDTVLILSYVVVLAQFIEGLTAHML